MSKLIFRNIIIGFLFCFLQNGFICKASNFSNNYCFIDNTENYQQNRNQPLLNDILNEQVYEKSKEGREEYLKVSLANALEVIKEIETLLKCDPLLLEENGSNLNPKIVEESDINFLVKMKRFYEKKEIRDNNLLRDIFIPILETIKQVGDYSYEFPQILRTLDSEKLSDENFKKAFIDILQDRILGIPALKSAYLQLKSKGELVEEARNNLVLYRALAGYYFDSEAIKFLHKTNRTFLNQKFPLTENELISYRLLLIRTLQLNGEILKTVTPFYLSVIPELDESILTSIRDQLSHLTSSRFRTLIGLNSKKTFLTEGFLSELLKEMTFLNQSYEKIVKTKEELPKYWQTIKTTISKNMDGNNAPSWKNIKNLLVESSPKSNGRKPFKNLSKFLEPKLKNLQPLEFTGDLNLFLEILSENLIKKRTKNEKIHKYYHLGVALSQYKTLEEVVNYLKSKDINLQHTETVEKYLSEIALIDFKAKEALKQSGLSLRDEKRIKKKFEQARDTLTFNSKMVDKKFLKISKVKKEITSEKLFNFMKTFKPTYGYGQVNKQYSIFMEGLNKEFSLNENLELDWSKDVSLLERAFYISHKIPMQDKLVHRQKRIKEFLGLIDVLSDLVGYTADLGREQREMTSSEIFHQTNLLAKDIEESIRNCWEKLGKKCELNFTEQISSKKTNFFINFVNFSLEEYETQMESIEMRLKKEYLKSYNDQTYNILNKFNANNQSTSFTNFINQEFEKKVELLSFSTNERLNLYENYFSELFKVKSTSKNFKKELQYFEPKKQINQKIMEKQIKKSYRFHTPNFDFLTEKFKNNQSLRIAVEFFIAFFYDNLLQISDYPELEPLKGFKQVRNQLFHFDPTADEPIVVWIPGTRDVNISSDPNQQIAKEAIILIRNVRFILEDGLKKKFFTNLSLKLSDNDEDFEDKKGNDFFYYVDNDISDYLGAWIKHSSEVHQPNGFRFLLSSQKDDPAPIKDEQEEKPYFVAYFEAITTVQSQENDINQAINIDYYFDRGSFDKISGSKDPLEEILETLIKFKPQSEKTAYGELLQKIEELKRGVNKLESIHEILETHQKSMDESLENIQKSFQEKLENLQKAKKDVFDELMPCLLKEDLAYAKILFPYNLGNFHWLTGEIKLHKEHNNYTVEVYTHDPYGSGKMGENIFEKLKKVIEKRLKECHPQCEKIVIENKESPYVKGRQMREDAISCGVIASEDLLNRITGKPLETIPYPIGAKDLRQQQIEMVVISDPKSSFITRNKERLQFFRW